MIIPLRGNRRLAVGPRDTWLTWSIYVGITCLWRSMQSHTRTRTHTVIHIKYDYAYNNKYIYIYIYMQIVTISLNWHYEYAYSLEYAKSVYEPILWPKLYTSTQRLYFADITIHGIYYTLYIVYYITIWLKVKSVYRRQQMYPLVQGMIYDSYWNTSNGVPFMKFL